MFKIIKKYFYLVIFLSICTNSFSGYIYSTQIPSKGETIGFSGSTGGGSFNINNNSSLDYINPVGSMAHNSSRTSMELPLAYGTYTNFWVNYTYPAVNSGTNLSFIILTNGVEAMRATLVGGASAQVANLCSNTTSSFTVSSTTLCCLLCTNNSISSVSGVYMSWKCGLVPQ
jgi:hypothetical protein